MTVIREWLKKRFPDEDINQILEPEFNIIFNIPDDVIDWINRNDDFVIVGDYDVDGTTSSVILAKSLLKYGKSVKSIFIPYKEDGYSLNDRMLRKLIDTRYTNIILIDNGINAGNEIEYLKKHGKNILVIDHHIDNTGIDGIVKYHDTSTSSGVLAFKLAHKLLGKSARWFLDYATLSLIGDVIPLTGENRVIAKYGIVVANNSKSDFMNKMKKSYIDEITIMYHINPVINSALRLGMNDDVIKALFNGNNDSISRMISANYTRKRMTHAIVNSLIKDGILYRDINLVIAYGEFNVNFTGLIANMLNEKLGNHVAVVMSKWRDGKAVGSIRSKYIDIHSIVSEYDGNIEFGGHKHAVGFKIPESEVSRFADFIKSKNLTAFDIEIVQHDIELDEIDEEFISDYIKLKPFGNGWEEPIIKLNNIEILSPYYIRSGKVFIETTTPVERADYVIMKIVGIDNDKLLVKVLY